MPDYEPEATHLLVNYSPDGQMSLAIQPLPPVVWGSDRPNEASLLLVEGYRPLWRSVNYYSRKWTRPYWRWAYYKVRHSIEELPWLMLRLLWRRRLISITTPANEVTQFRAIRPAVFGWRAYRMAGE